jgi:hypothetical protein
MITTIGIFLAFTVCCASSQFAVCVDSGLVSNDAILDASAMATSRLQDSLVWVCNGHSDHSRIHALNTHGKEIATYYLNKTFQRNWEDMASGPGPDPTKTYLYVGDIGDNDSQWATKTIYRFVEPYAILKGDSVIDTIKELDKLVFVYPDTFHNAEAFMVDPLTRDYYVITKHAQHGRVYRARYPQPTASIDTLEYLDSIPYGMITAADISASGAEILLKNYGRIYYWKREPGESIIQTIVKPTNQKIPYHREPIGEAMCWTRNADGYFTLSEERDSVHCRLYYYKRLGAVQTLLFFPVVVAPQRQQCRLVIIDDSDHPRAMSNTRFDLSGRKLLSAPSAMQPFIKNNTPRQGNDARLNN